MTGVTDWMAPSELTEVSNVSSMTRRWVSVLMAPSLVVSGTQTSARSSGSETLPPPCWKTLSNWVWAVRALSFTPFSSLSYL